MNFVLIITTPSEIIMDVNSVFGLYGLLGFFCDRWYNYGATIHDHLANGFHYDNEGREEYYNAIDEVRKFGKGDSKKLINKRAAFMRKLIDYMDDEGGKEKFEKDPDKYFESMERAIAQ